MKTVKLYRFKISGKATEPLMMEHIDDYATRTEGRKIMNSKRHSDAEYKYALYDGSTFLSSTF